MAPAPGSAPARRGLVCMAHAGVVADSVRDLHAAARGILDDALLVIQRDCAIFIPSVDRVGGLLDQKLRGPRLLDLHLADGANHAAAGGLDAATPQLEDAIAHDRPSFPRAHIRSRS